MEPKHRGVLKDFSTKNMWGFIHTTEIEPNQVFLHINKFHAAFRRAHRDLVPKIGDFIAFDLENSDGSDRKRAYDAVILGDPVTPVAGVIKVTDPSGQFGHIHSEQFGDCIIAYDATTQMIGLVSEGAEVQFLAEYVGLPDMAFKATQVTVTVPGPEQSVEQFQTTEYAPASGTATGCAYQGVVQKIVGAVGFIECKKLDPSKVIFDLDVVQGNSVEVGDFVAFDAHTKDPLSGRFKASEVVVGGKPNQQLQGVVKSYRETGYGFLTCDTLGSADIYFDNYRIDMSYGCPRVGDRVTFTVEICPKKGSTVLAAKEVRVQSQGGSQFPTPSFMTASSPARFMPSSVSTMIPLMEDPLTSFEPMQNLNAALASLEYRGIVKNFFATKAWGFVSCNSFEQPVFFHNNDLMPEYAPLQMPKEGDIVAFNQGQGTVEERAKAESAIIIGDASTRFHGVVRSMKSQTSWGFITCTQFGSMDIFFHVSDCLYPVTEGAAVTFTVTPNDNKNAQFKALAVMLDGASLGMNMGISGLNVGGMSMGAMSMGGMSMGGMNMGASLMGAGMMGNMGASTMINIFGNKNQMQKKRALNPMSHVKIDAFTKRTKK